MNRILAFGLLAELVNDKNVLVLVGNAGEVRGGLTAIEDLAHKHELDVTIYRANGRERVSRGAHHIEIRCQFGTDLEHEAARVDVLYLSDTACERLRRDDRLQDRVMPSLSYLRSHGVEVIHA